MDATPHELRALFLRTFVQQLIVNYPTANNTMPPTLFGEASALERIAIPLQETTLAVQFKDYLNSSDRGDLGDGPAKIVAIRELEETPIPQPRAPPQRRPQQAIQAASTQLERWLTDPTLESIECTGPERPLLMKKKEGVTVTTPQLTNEEIKKIVNELALKSRTSLQEGILKADTQHWSAIATISEFGGNRFLIQKKRVART